MKGPDGLMSMCTPPKRDERMAFFESLITSFVNQWGCQSIVVLEILMRCSVVKKYGGYTDLEPPRKSWWT